MKKINCENCEYWNCFPNDNNFQTLGSCRRNAPLLRAYLLSDEEKDNEEDGEPIGIGGVWPDTLPSDWCGEFKSKNSQSKRFKPKGQLHYD